ncbi:hypothetical protein ACJJTC_003989 [Scirpophaga incertulas]
MAHGHEWDSVASQPLGILSGNRFQLGNFDQCMTSPWNKRTQIRTQYCLAEVDLERNNHVKKKRLDEVGPYENALDFIEHHTPYYRPLKYLTWGACVPVSCGPRSVERLVGAVLAHSHLSAAGLRPRITVNESCQISDQATHFDTGFYAFMSLFGFMSAICIVSTILCRHNETNGENQIKLNLYKAFCIKSNAVDLLNMKKDGIEVLYGIRFLTICFIVICHHAGFLNAGPISNGIKVDDNLTIFGWVILHDDLLVDTFFVISGFLVAKNLVHYKRLPNILLMIVKRYVRLVVALAIVIFFLVSVFPHIGSGPLWNRYVMEESGACRENGWLNILMLSNYINPDRVCLVISWYIPCDFHFFVIAVVVFAMFKKYPRCGVLCAGALSVAAVVTPGVVNYVNNLQAIQLFTYEFVADPRKNEQFHKTYIKSHTRAAAYVIGFFSGYLLMYCRKKKVMMMSQSKSVIIACVALVIMVFVTMLGVSYHYRNYSKIEGAFYAALNRPIWAFGVVLLILSCIFGKVPVVTSFLSWYPWVPLSRLAYGIYLVHTIIVTRSIAISRNSVYYDNFSVFMNSVSVIVVSSFFALVLWLLFEAPANNLLILMFKNRQPVRPTVDESVAGTSGGKINTQMPKGKSNLSYIDDNLPTRIEFSSKM